MEVNLFHPVYNYTNTAIDAINKRLQESPGCSLAYSPDSVFFHSGYLYESLDTPRPKKTVSIVICTYGRPESLNDTLHSLAQQTWKGFEVVLISEKGDLSRLRQRGLESAVGDIVSLIDDDVYCEPTWLESVVKTFKERKGVVGVTGPTIITSEYQQNRDSIRYTKLRKLQEWLFGVPSEPGRLSSCGAPSMASNFEGCEYEGEVAYLECCNMSVKRKEALDVGGFENFYIRTSEWCEVDLSLKIAKKGKLIFVPECKLYHRPSKAGIYKARLQTNHRWENFIKFQKRWIRPGLRTYAYRAFIWTYFQMKSLRMI